MNPVNGSDRPAQACLIRELTSVVSRLDFASWFIRNQPVEVELGSGDGGFLVEWARRHPDRNFVGIERLLGRLRKLDRKGRQVRLTNLVGVRIEAGYCLEHLLPIGGVQCLHVYFPDPWPKRRHWGRRLVNERFPELAYRALVSDGRVYLRTDDAPYREQMQSVFADHPGFEACDAPTDLADLVTEFEREFVEARRRIWRLAYRRKSDVDHWPPTLRRST